MGNVLLFGGYDRPVPAALGCVGPLSFIRDSPVGTSAEREA